MKVTYEFTEEDYVRLWKLSLRRRYSKIDYRWWALRWVLVGICFSVLVSVIQGSIVGVSNPLIFVLFVGLIDLPLDHLVARLRAGSQARHYFRHHRLGRQFIVEVQPEGVAGWSPVGNDFNFWEGVRAVTQDDHFVYISMYSAWFYSIPKRIFFQEAEVEKLFETARSYLEKSRSRWDNVADA